MTKNQKIILNVSFNISIVMNILYATLFYTIADNYEKVIIKDTNINSKQQLNFPQILSKKVTFSSHQHFLLQDQ